MRILVGALWVKNAGIWESSLCNLGACSVVASWESKVNFLSNPPQEGNPMIGDPQGRQDNCAEMVMPPLRENRHIMVNRAGRNKRVHHHRMLASAPWANLRK